MTALRRSPSRSPFNSASLSSDAFATAIAAAWRSVSRNRITSSASTSASSVEARGNRPETKALSFATKSSPKSNSIWRSDFFRIPEGSSMPSTLRVSSPRSQLVKRSPKDEAGCAIESMPSSVKTRKSASRQER